MESIIFLIIFIVFRALVSGFAEAQKSQRPPVPQTPQKPREFHLPKDIRPKRLRIPVEEIKPLDVKPEISSISIENEQLEKTSEQLNVRPLKLLQEELPQDEPEDAISELFSEENILRGIILQEILSPPKALMPRHR